MNGVNQTNFFQTKPGLIVTGIISVLILIVLVIILNYFNILSLSKQAGKTNLSTIKPILNSQDFSFKIDNLFFPCPAPKEFCESGLLSTFKGNPAISYNLDPGKIILSAVDINDDKEIELLQNDIEKTKTLLISSQSGQDCYTIFYTVPADSQFNNFDKFPIKSGQILGLMGQEKISTGSAQGNLVVRVKKLFDPATDCFTKGNPKKEVGSFQKIEDLDIQ